MEARSTKQVHGSKKQKPSSETINLAVEKKSWVQHKYMQVQKNMPVRSKKHVQVQKKGAQVQKTCIPMPTTNPTASDLVVICTRRERTTSSDHSKTMPFNKSLNKVK